ncbi:MAG: DUF1156 domain-containing protein [Candidatus Riflebacteria bacterium]|nr:DUF1156 domain-containing protein [Candidatus Riflebacteria bacterium]
MKFPKKLIEVALPLDSINVAAAREKSIRHGHPSTLHLWWARRPLAACRAVLFAQMVNDPGGERGWGAYPGQTKAHAQKEREELFEIIRDLVQWENTTNEAILKLAREAIMVSWAETCKITGEDPKKLPPFLDPFSGGGSIPLEAQRLGLEAHGSDLNPVAVMIGKALIEIPPKFIGRKPIGPLPRDEKVQKKIEDWSGAKGLAEDVRRYGAWIREEAFKRIGHLYPQIELTKEVVQKRPDLAGLLGQKLTVIAWLWARTVASPNPALRGAHVPLVTSFWLSTKKGKETWVEPVVRGTEYSFEIRTGKPFDETAIDVGTKLGRGANFKCLLSGNPIDQQFIRAEFRAKRTGERLMAIVAEGKGGRVYLPPFPGMEALVRSALPNWKPEIEMNPDCKDLLSGRGYGFQYWHELFTQRQLVFLSTLSDLVGSTREKVFKDAVSVGWKDDQITLADGGSGPAAYADAVAVYLSFALDKSTEGHSTICTWSSASKNELVVSTFRRQALPMTWDFAESNPFASSSGSWEKIVDAICRVFAFSIPGIGTGTVTQVDAQHLNRPLSIISSDPPYYDNIGYADLSDYFYVWMRRSLKSIFPNLFSTLLVPKAEELIASSYRHGSHEKAEVFFLSGMTKAIENMSRNSHHAFPVTIYYAFKQSDTIDNSTASTGWDTFLAAVLKAGFAITGTWPMRTERDSRSIGIGTNALASSIVLVCRKRDSDAATISRKQFLRELQETLPESLEAMIGGTATTSPIAPVDLAQAAIGPGMGVFSKYTAVLDAEGQPMTVRTALTLINKTIDEYFSNVESSMDADTRFCVDWFQQYGFKPGAFGEADVLARAKGTSVDGVQKAGVIEAKSGSVRLYKLAEYPSDWDPRTDTRIPIWEALHHMIRTLRDSEASAGKLLAMMPDKIEQIRQLAYRLYTLCERNNWAEDARAYNELILTWPAILTASHQVGHHGTQKSLDLE